ncbi:RNA repair transcriptional activator RtcR family protein [Shewanella algae]|nr:RNA repair transcriptional activator RtcR family protein [Shewanella algae]
MKHTVVVSLVGTQLDYTGKGSDRWAKWRPNVSLCSQEDLIVSQLHMLHDNHSKRLASSVAGRYWQHFTGNRSRITQCELQ